MTKRFLEAGALQQTVAAYELMKAGADQRITALDGVANLAPLVLATTGLDSRFVSNTTSLPRNPTPTELGAVPQGQVLAGAYRPAGQLQRLVWSGSAWQNSGKALVDQGLIDTLTETGGVPSRLAGGIAQALATGAAVVQVSEGATQGQMLSLAAGQHLVGNNRGDGQLDTLTFSAGITTGLRLTRNNRAEGLRLVGPGAGKGVDLTDAYWGGMKSISAEGWAAGVYAERSLYLQAGQIEARGNLDGLVFHAAPGNFNQDWFNNVQQLDLVNAIGNTRYALDYEGQGLSIGNLDVSGSGSQAGDDGVRAAIRIRPRSYDVNLPNVYAEALAPGTHVLYAEGGVTHFGGWFQGGAAGSATRAGAVIKATGGTVIVHTVTGQDYWERLVDADGANTTVVLMPGCLKAQHVYELGKIRATNGAKIVDLSSGVTTPEQQAFLSQFAAGSNYDSAFTQAAAAAGPGGRLIIPQNSTGDAVYTFTATPAAQTSPLKADPNVVLSIPTSNGITFKDWKLQTTLKLHVRDRKHDITLVPNATGLEYLAQVSTGDLLRPLGLQSATALDGTTLSRVTRLTSGTSRDPGNATLAARSVSWDSGSGSTGIDAAIVTSPAVGTHASGAMATDGATTGRVGVLIEAGTEMLYVSTDAYKRFVGVYTSSWTEDAGVVLPSQAYSAIGGGTPEYAWRITDVRTAEVYINGSLAHRRTFTADITSAGWGVFYTALVGHSVVLRDMVIGSSERSHVGRPVNLLVQGDSVSFGEGTNLGWVDAMALALKGELGISATNITNRAVSGQNSTQQRASLEASGAAGFDVGVIAVGINDQQQFADLDAYRTNLTAMVTRMRADGCAPVLVVPHMYLDQRDVNYGFASQNYAQAGQYHAVVRRVAAELGVPVADTAAAVGEINPATASLLTRDNLHPTVQGHIQIAREVGRAVLLALTRRVASAVGGSGTAGRGISSTTRLNSRTLRQTYTDGGTQDILIPANRGPWTANTDYLQGDTYTYQLQLWTANADHNSGATWNAANSTLSVARGADGATGPRPFLLTGITGGANNRLLSLNSDGVTAAEVVPTMLDQINFKQLVWRDNNGEVWLPGALITEPAGANLPADTVRALQQKTSLTGPNWRDLSPTAAIPADLTATADKPYVEFGRNVSPTSWRFLEPRADGLAPNPISRFDGLLVANYPRGAAIPTSRWLTNMWSSFDSATNPAYTVNQTVGTNYPYGASLGFSGTGSFTTRIATDQTTPQAANGQVRALLQKAGGSGTIGVGMRLSGTSTTKNGILAKIDDGQGPSTSFQIVDYTNNVSTVLASHPNFTPVHGTFYDMLLECEDTLIRAKAWPAGTTEPADWMLVGYTSQIGSGYFGVTANIDTVNMSRYSTVVGNGAKAAAAGAT